jgi:3alpha(or 20beta)-hydroxysteroid dehydrogenase
LNREGLLEGKVALITGGARGQGAAEGRLFATEGAQVILTDLLDEEGEALAGQLGPAVRFWHHDVASEQDWAGVVDKLLSEYGKLDILVNNAGINLVAPLLETSVEDFQRLIAVNQIGTFLGIKTVAPTMIAARRGSIVNISSTAGLRGIQNMCAYSATKWAIRGMTKTAALELAPFNVKVNSVHPGIIDNLFSGGPITGELRSRGTASIPMGRLGTSEDVARAVLFLACDLNTFSTGAELLVDGGQLSGSFRRLES